MKYDIEYKVYKFPKYTNELSKLINETGDVKIYILDVELPGISGLEIASEIREDDDDSIIIFATAHPDYRDDIFYSRLSAIDYIPKQQLYQERLQNTIEYVIDKKYKNKSISIISKHNHCKILYKEINYIEKCQMQNKCIIHLVDGETKEVITSITKMKEQLGNTFFQTHKSCLVNLKNIKNIDYSNCIITFQNGDKTTLFAVATKKELREHARNI
ncbi:MAG: LytTR family DNA-binding domain-containing protein, partial [Bacilli bacterium]|nr:LytTR family DNA-binding domain-containing protein [Bacilli bacterium]